MSTRVRFGVRDVNVTITHVRAQPKICDHVDCTHSNHRLLMLQITKWMLVLKRGCVWRSAVTHIYIYMIRLWKKTLGRDENACHQKWKYLQDRIWTRGSVDREMGMHGTPKWCGPSIVVWMELCACNHYKSAVIRGMWKVCPRLKGLHIVPQGAKYFLYLHHKEHPDKQHHCLVWKPHQEGLPGPAEGGIVSWIIKYQLLALQDMSRRMAERIIK